MSRDASGTYTLAAGNPVATGTTIESSWANSTLDDIADALTDSLSRTGQGGMLTEFRFADGSAAQPGLSWTTETNTGFYRDGFQDMRAVVSGVNATRWTTDGGGGAVFQIFEDSTGLWKTAAHENSSILFGAGTIDEPSISWWDETGMGWYRFGAGDIRFAWHNGVDAEESYRVFEGYPQTIFTPYDQTEGWYPLAANRLEASPDVDDKSSLLADTNFVRRWSPMIMMGVLDSDSPSILGDSEGIAGWVPAGNAEGLLTLSTPLTNVNNAIISVTMIWDGTQERHVVAEVVSVTEIRFRWGGSGGAAAVIDALSVSIYDTGLLAGV